MPRAPTALQLWTGSAESAADVFEFSSVRIGTLLVVATVAIVAIVTRVPENPIARSTIPNLSGLAIMGPL
jgi:hypothetical protein